MRTLTRTFAAALFVLGAALPAAAQPSARDLNTPPVVGRIDVGANGAVFLGPEGGWLAGGPQVTINLTRREALQFGADVRHERGDTWSNVMGIYSFAYRYALSETHDTRVFALVGAAGMFERSHRNAVTYTTPAYTTTINGVKKEYPAQTRDYPAYTRWEKTAPVIVLGGVGAEGYIARRLVVHGQVALGVATFGGVAVRVSAGLSVPLGRVSR